jgi:hypothetical protein
MLAFGKQAPASISAPALVSSLPKTGTGAHIRYYDSVPDFVGPELERLYRHVHCSLAHFRFRKRTEDASTYVATRAGRIAAIFVHRREGDTVTVLNEMVALDARDLAQFARFMFAHFAGVARISFSMIGKEIGKLPFPYQQYGSSEDIAVALPPTEDAYFISLSKKTRRILGQRLDELAHAYPGLEFRHFHDGAIDPRHVQALADLKRTNFRRQHALCCPDPGETAWLAQRACAGGLLTLAVMGDRICGGSLSLRIGDAYFAALAAYDSEFCEQGLDMLGCYVMIREKIARGARRIHLGWKRDEYRFKLRGVRQEMANLDIYRSRLACLRQAPRLIGNATRTARAGKGLHAEYEA